MRISTEKNGLHKAKLGKKDEFYTQLVDIEKEMVHYREQFKDKHVFLNCDDPTWSNFYMFFNLNFEFLGLKQLTATHYNKDKSSYRLDVYPGSEKVAINGVEMSKGIETGLVGDGDFRSEESIDILKEADIVVTNPPFSLFREYIAQLFDHGKQFIILGNMNAITYKEIFPFFKSNELWYGHSITSGDREFRVPDNYPLTASGFRIDEEGNKFVRVKGVRWFTNMDHNRRHEELVLYRKYDPETYPAYDNYNAINVDKTKHIPIDYEGAIGVPITFMDKYNPEQFEILGLDRYMEDNPKYGKRFDLNGKEKYARILIQHKNTQSKE